MLEELKAGRVLDVLIAENVMGWHQPLPPNSDWFDGKGMSRSVGKFRPSTRDDHALEALEKFKIVSIFKIHDGSWRCRIGNDLWKECSGNTFALAVSRAVVLHALKNG